MEDIPWRLRRDIMEPIDSRQSHAPESVRVYVSQHLSAVANTVRGLTVSVKRKCNDVITHGAGASAVFTEIGVSVAEYAFVTVLKAI